MSLASILGVPRTLRLGRSVAAAMLGVSVLGGVTAVTAPAARAFTNPVYSSADPFVTYQNGVYLMLGTNYRGDVTIVRSPTIAGLSSSPQLSVFGTPRGFEAPEIYWLNNHWYIYYTDFNANGMVVIESDTSDPAGTYHFKNVLTTNSYDGTILQVNGALYLVSSTFGDLQVQTMSNPYTVSSGMTSIAHMDQPWESAVIEAPNQVNHNGQTFLLYSSGVYNQNNYAVGALRYNGGDPTNAASWTKLSGPRFTGNGGDAFGAGAASAFYSPDGTQTWFAYSAYNGAPVGDNRTIRIQQMSWNGDNTPNMGAPVGLGVNLPEPSSGGAAASVSNGVYEILAKTTGNALDCTGCGNTNGTQVELWNTLGGSCQQWAVSYKGGGAYSVRTINPDGSVGRSLDATGCSPNDGTQVELWDFSFAPCQQWQINPQPDGFFNIATNQAKSDGTHDVLDGNGCSGAAGTHVILWSWGGGGCQQEWQFAPINTPAIVSGAYYTLTNVAAGLNLDDPNGTNAAGTKVQLFPANGATAQNWKLTRQADGNYTLTNQAGGLNLDDPNGLGAGTLQQIWPANGASAQEWKLTASGSGAYTLTNAATNLNLDDPNGANTAGTQLQLWPSNGATPQQWRLTPQ
ncbi:hypothetical protein CCAX7_32650 [Capsulimonas corticalis]|uniref:Ricin B lectin domain-containing protein n=1 Tax=Capsulimonas corticalis TaxID=2219043 RepID=A0A9N7L6E1_9BACT|nr:RICIN domain-containing protein [Capsulimonas corticalis]BDI31214.1 hypothetical protein CCAX7_32650 [Capsulimonas corticalis]